MSNHPKEINSTIDELIKASIANNKIISLTASLSECEVKIERNEQGAVNEYYVTVSYSMTVWNV
jgi:hypothetical protein